MSKVALAMIVKNDTEYDQLVKCLESVEKHVDGMFITTTSKPNVKIKKLIEDKKGNLSFFKWIDDFSAARNYNFSKVTKDFDWILWLDADDIVINPENIKLIIKDMEERNIVWASLAYEYIKNALGNNDDEHWKIRIVKNDGHSVWHKSVHENLEYDGFYQWEKYTDVVVEHDFKDEVGLEKKIRNYNILIKEFEQDGDKTDSRTLMYLGSTSFGIGLEKDFPKREDMLRQSLYFNSKYIEISGSDDDKYFATVQLGLTYNYLGDVEKARRSFVNATIIKPNWADAYWYMCMLETDEQRFAEAVEWGETALTKSRPQTVLGVNNILYDVNAPFMLCQSYLATGQTKKASALVQKLPKIDKFDKFRELVQKQYELDDYAMAALKYILYSKKYSKLDYQSVLETVPTTLMDNMAIQEAVLNDILPKKWDKKSIVFFCGQSLEEWCPLSISKGIGGSEEATINVALALHKQGYAVTVYNNCGLLEGNYKGVEYINHTKFNPNDTFDTLIIWRNPAFFLLNLKATKKYLWLHDKPEPFQFNDIIVKNIDKIIVLSAYHRSCLPDIANDKFLVSANGINLDDVKKIDDMNIEKVKGRVIYGSSYDRGLDHFLDIIEQIKDKVKVKPVVMYGWDGFDKVYKNDPEKQAWKMRMDQRMIDLGVENLGRVSHKQVLEEYAKADVWLYPTAFWEISCITAMKAQAMGAIPVTTDYAALNETVQFGYKVSGVTEFMVLPDEVKKEMANKAIEALTTPFDREEMMQWARKTFSWATVAKQWVDDICIE